MASADKEKILVELRAYHTTPFAEPFSSTALHALRDDFSGLEDQIVASILDLINGHTELANFDTKLAEFKRKLGKLVDIKAQEKELFLQKIEQLGAVLALAGQAHFKMRPPRYRKQAR